MAHPVACLLQGSARLQGSCRLLSARAFNRAASWRISAPPQRRSFGAESSAPTSSSGHPLPSGEGAFCSSVSAYHGLGSTPSASSFSAYSSPATPPAATPGSSSLSSSLSSARRSLSARRCVAMSRLTHSASSGSRSFCFATSLPRASLGSSPRLSSERASTVSGHWTPLSPSASSLLASLPGGVSAVRSAHKFAAPPCPNLLLLRKSIHQRLQPILFFLKNDTTMGNYVYDQHFKGVLCSPLFEGKSYKEINAMVDRVLEDIGLSGRVKLYCQPPSLMHVRRHGTKKRNTSC
ncbi:hypothetical protein BESB_060840 [Besnoitia besnoiti]|uniref:Uncharacterized protein n=1 Tax=Besnoitia besnoiti TaxID=94643 RepID=A0A2A9MHX8_BESBE|nr:hypothetical protein BESB_060840 [Besnoitia besnoiti]PFH35197.1 hypothetical protein BESB_060840 [Besnoitia besnoiti]